MIAIALACLPAASQQAGSTATYTPTEQPKGKAFLKPDAAAAALYAAAKRNDEAELLVILGPDGKEIVQWSDDLTERQEQRAEFAQKYEQMHRLILEPDNTVALYVGAENWPLPIPLVGYHGAWYFDAELGRQEIRYRRIGDNETEALGVCRTLVDAEKEYRAIAKHYTAKFISSDGSHDGLYWKSADATTRSPIGPHLAQAGVTRVVPGIFGILLGHEFTLLGGAIPLAALMINATFGVDPNLAAGFGCCDLRIGNNLSRAGRRHSVRPSCCPFNRVRSRGRRLPGRF